MPTPPGVWSGSEGRAGPGAAGGGEELPDEFWGAADYCGYLRAEYDAGGRCADPTHSRSQSPCCLQSMVT
jgi:hypothetical protein